MLVVIMVMKYGAMLRSADYAFSTLTSWKDSHVIAWLFFLFPFPSIEKLGYAGNRPFFEVAIFSEACRNRERAMWGDF